MPDRIETSNEYNKKPQNKIISNFCFLILEIYFVDPNKTYNIVLTTLECVQL